MRDMDMIRLLVRTLEMVETRLLPWWRNFVHGCKCRVANLVKKFRFQPPAGQSFMANLVTLRLWCPPSLWPLLRRPADWLLRLRKLPRLCAVFHRLGDGMAEFAFLIGSVALFVGLWCLLWIAPSRL